MLYTLSSYTLDVCEMLVTGLVAEWRGGFVDLDFSKALATVSHPCLVAGGPAGGQLLMLCHRAQYWGGYCSSVTWQMGQSTSSAVSQVTKD